MNFLKKLNFNGFFNMRLLTITIVLIAIVGIGTYTLKYGSVSHASGNTYSYLGESTQNPITNPGLPSTSLQIADSALVVDQTAVTNDQALISAQNKVIQADQTAINTATTALANARIAYTSGPNAGNPNIKTRVDNDQKTLNNDNAIKIADTAAKTKLTTILTGDNAKVAVDQTNVIKYTPINQQTYLNSDFYSYACQSPGSISGTVDVDVAMVASSYVAGMQNGSYLPHAAVMLNNNQTIDLGSAWNYIGILATQSSHDQAGAWLTANNSLNNLLPTDTILLGPLPTSSYTAAWSSIYSVGDLSQCNPSTTPTTPLETATGSATKASVITPPSNLRTIVDSQPEANQTYFDDAYWYWPSNPSGYTEMDAYITPTADGSPDGYYFANASDAFTGYLGLETEDGALNNSKAAKFTIWGAISSSGPGYNATASQNGSTFYTSQIKYNWVTNHIYDLKVTLTNESTATNTWTAIVTDLTTVTSSTIGSIVTPSSIGTLYNESITFHERYSGVTPSCGNIFHSAVTFSNLTANNGSVSPISHETLPPVDSICNGEYETENMPVQLINIMW
ncbi:MAG TPA: hypothetical protein VII94_04425 [Candidatus Saccharimonadales bacterium]